MRKEMDVASFVVSTRTILLLAPETEHTHRPITRINCVLAQI